MIYWFIGQPGCGKTTLAKALQTVFNDVCTSPTLHLDGDDLRCIFGNLYSKEHFTSEFRQNNTKVLQSFVEHVDKQGIDVIVSTVNSNREVREELKKRNNNVKEIYVVNSGNHVREEYAVNNFEEPLENFIKIDTNGKSISDSIKEILKQI